MSRINTAPRALQDLLGNTAAGVNPSTLADVVRPSFDMLPFWSVDKTDYVQFAGQIAAVFQQQTIRVPEGEIWVPLSMSADITGTVIGEFFSIVVGVANDANIIRVHLGEGETKPFNGQSSALETVAATYTWSMLQPVPAGNYFYVQCHRFNAAAARNVNFRVRFIRLLA